MIEFDKPKIIVTDDDSSHASFSVEPLERGYGTTLGNSLRRVLLNSLPGAAINSVKIDGVFHEFSTIDGVVEDVTQIVLNIKNIIIKMKGNEEREIEIDFNGPGEIKALDIKASEGIEIINPDLHIATVTAKKNLHFVLTVNKGRGYYSANENKEMSGKQDEIGVIFTDSIYTPVKKVNYKVENTRVGRSDDYDKLTIDIWTNGSIAPDDSLKQGSSILTEHLNVFTQMEATEFDEPQELMVEQPIVDEEKDDSMSIDELNLNARSYNCLKKDGINTIKQLTSKTENDLNNVKNLGKKSVEEIVEKLKDHGLSLQD